MVCCWMAWVDRGSTRNGLKLFCKLKYVKPASDLPEEASGIFMTAFLEGKDQEWGFVLVNVFL